MTPAFLPHPAHKDRFADVLASAIYAQLINPFERAVQKALDAFKGLPIQPKVTIGSDGSPSFEFSFGAQSHDSDRAIEHLLALAGRIARERGRRVALVFDEFQEVLEIDEHLPALMRSVFQLQGDVAHVFLGSKRHLMHDVFMRRNQPLYKMAKPLVLQPIAPHDFAAFIKDRCAYTGLKISDAAIDAILNITGGHPHDTQELCYFMWAQARSERIAAVEPEHIDGAVEQVLDAESAYYTMLWDELSPHQRLVLLALAAEPGRVYGESYRQRHRLGSAASMQRSVSRLLEREIIDQDERADYRIGEVFFRAWLDRRIRPNASL